VVEYALRVGLALNCQITKHSKFDRKNYFYPDLPKAYQVSQLYMPICKDGWLEIEGTNQEAKRIRIREVHMEEDAGKLLHDAGHTCMDFNRCGVPLLEIVSQPDFSSADEVVAFLEKLRETLLYLDICDCKMQEGSLRADVNLSIRTPGGELGTRTETKNMNSFKAIGRAIEYETARQIEILENGGSVFQETRRWDDDRGLSYGMRSKENAHDYRYFPEPDLLPLDISEAWLDEVRKSLPEMAWQKRERYIKEYGLLAKQAAVLTAHGNIAALFEAVLQESGEATESANLLTGEIMYLMNQNNTPVEELSLTKEVNSAQHFIDAGKLATLVRLVTDKQINRNTYKEAIEAVFLDDVEPEAYIKERGLLMVSDDSAVTEVVGRVIAANPGAVDDYRAGKAKAFGFLMGQAMRELGGSANPELVKEVLERSLCNLENQKGQIT
jgi:aspartyl-tRNA(Asn)/glutamyl-tRNA(Gln) amidotransferase subunit B